MRRLLVVLGIASSLGSAIPAHADPNVDASFVDALTKAGITFNDSRSAISAGKTACELMDQGKSQNRRRSACDAAKSGDQHDECR